MVALATENAVLNGLSEQTQFAEGDVTQLAGPDQPYDHVMMNPPYFEEEKSRPSPNAARQLSRMEGAGGLGVWVDAALRSLGHKGSLTLVLRTGRLDDFLAAVEGRAGEVKVFPLWPTKPDDTMPGKPAKQMIVSARKGIKSPLALLPGLVLHENGHTYTAEANRILRDGEALNL